MTVMVTGAAGFLGRAVVNQLLERRYDVRCLVHTPGQERLLPLRQVDVHYGDTLDPDALDSAFYNLETVVHLAAIIRPQPGRPLERVNHQGTRQVVAAARAAGARHFIHISSIGAVNDPSQAYLHTRWLGEQAVIASGLPYTIIRPSLIFGRRDRFIRPLAALARVFPIVPVIGSGRNRVQPIHVADAARCIALAVGREDLKGDILELGGPRQPSYDEIVALVVHALGRARWRCPLPLGLATLAAQALEQFWREPAIGAEQARLLARRNVADRDTVRQVFGFDPRPLEGNIEFVKELTGSECWRILLGARPPLPRPV